ncbi:hypothetical protein GcM3_104024 [Golovinomyces cichoracearum]|uniref:DDE-1 domain-containing protein n=1 Tax=Golovinomyces cichoracearum TaxID=62708 RepID=A0A420I9W4_9PEZI|nr:hypothetical protein GcM3_104024 [Golovinomyces cichoracearum]
MPLHSFHLLQTLDISSISVVKRSYGSLVQEQIRLGINHIAKDDFLDLYIQARKDSFTYSTVRNGFKAAGIAPFGLDQVLDRLHVQLRTPSPPSVSTITPESYIPETLKNSAQLELHKEAVHGLIRCSIQSSPMPTVKAVKQLIKGFQLAMHRATLLTAENAKLQVANERAKKKRNKKKMYVRKGGILSAIEVREAHSGSSNRKGANDGYSEPTQSRAPRICSLCRSNTHTTRTCDKRRVIN